MTTLLTEPEPVTSPAASRESTILPASAASPRRLTVDESRTRILYVDDDHSLRRLGEQVLVRSGYDVDTADDGAEAWAALHDQEYHLLITDNQMPRLTGLELIRKVCLTRMSVPIILASGALGTLPIDDLPWLESGAMLAKPFTPEQLVSVVREVLRAAVSTRTSTGVRLPVLAQFHVRIEPHRRWGINE